MFFIPILFTNLVLLFNSSYALTFQTKNKLYFGQSRTMLELNSTEVEPIYIMEKQQEIWKDVVGFEGIYAVSNLGNVKSLDRITMNAGKYPIPIKGRLIKFCGDGRGYSQLVLSKNGVYYKRKVHRLVGLAFIPNPENKKEINHINGIKNDNREVNLEWVTHAENMQHAVNTGLLNNRGENHVGSKLKYSEVAKIRELLKMGLTQPKIASMFNVSRSAIMQIKNRKNSWLV